MTKLARNIPWITFRSLARCSEGCDITPVSYWTSYALICCGQFWYSRIRAQWTWPWVGCIIWTVEAHWADVIASESVRNG